MRSAFTPPTLQAVTRDFAFLVSADLPSGELVRGIKGCDKDNIVSVELFDQFAGQGVSEGQKSLAVEVTLQPKDKSFQEAELLAIHAAIFEAAKKIGAVMRTEANAKGAFDIPGSASG